MYNIRDYGALADGKTLCTQNIQRAIDDCHKNGGGRVVVPSGSYVTGTLWLRSNVELHLEMGALLLASTDLEDYNAEDAYEQNFGSAGEEWLGKHLILAVECENVAVTGLGVIDGRGDFFYEEPRTYPWMSGYGWRDGFSKARDKALLRPGQLMCFVECRHVTVQDITMKNGTCWSCFLHGCEYASIRGVKVFNGKTAGNTDGIDIDCCRFVTISDCIIDTGDDAITVRCDSKRLKNKEMLSEYITVTNCICSVSASAFRIGVGTGHIRHVRVSNIVIARAGTAIQYMTSYSHHGEAHIEDVNFSNLSADNVGFAVQIGGDVGSIRRVTLENIRMHSLAGTKIMAKDDCIVEDITLRNVDFHVMNDQRELSEGSLEKRGTHMLCVSNISGLTLDGVRVIPDGGASEKWDGLFFAEKCEKMILRNCNFEQ